MSMVGYEFEWDEIKNITNFRKYNITFEQAVAVFYDVHKSVIIDNRKDYGELREFVIGKSKGNIFLLTVVYTERNNIYRIISARKASTKEKTLYYGNN